MSSTLNFGKWMPTCLHKDCSSVVDPLTIMFALGPEMYFKMKGWIVQSMMDIQQEQWSSCTSCSAIVHVENLTMIRCECKRVFCSNIMCKNRTVPHWPLQCKEFEEAMKRTNKLNRKRINPTIPEFNLKVKPCPCCGEYIEKNDGCNHMRYVWFPMYFIYLYQQITHIYQPRCIKCNKHWCWVCGNPFQVGTPTHPTYYKCRAKDIFTAENISSLLSMSSSLSLKEELNYRIQIHVLKASSENGDFNHDSITCGAHHVLKMTYAFMLVHNERVPRVFKHFVKEMYNLTGIAEMCLERFENSKQQNVEDLGAILQKLIHKISRIRVKIQNYKEDDESSSSLRRHRNKIIRRTYVTGMGNSNRMVIANDRDSFRQFVLSRGASSSRGWFFMQWRLRRRGVVDTSFRREIMNGIVGYRGNNTGGWLPDHDRYSFVKYHSHSRPEARARHRKEREDRDAFGATEREKRKARNRARKMVKKDKRRRPKTWAD
jgi:hypothetical protein